MSSLLHPYSFWIKEGQYFFDTPSGTQYVAYFLELPIAKNLYTFNFDRIQLGSQKIPNEYVFDTICFILLEFFKKHTNSMLIVCDSSDGREEARMRLFNSWYKRISPKGLNKINKSGRAETYNLLISILFWNDNPNKDQLLLLLDEYFNTMLL